MQFREVTYTFDYDTFISVIFRYSQKLLFGSFWHFLRNIYFDSFKNDTFESVWVDAHSQSGMVCTRITHSWMAVLTIVIKDLRGSILNHILSYHSSEKQFLKKLFNFLIWTFYFWHLLFVLIRWSSSPRRRRLKPNS